MYILVSNNISKLPDSDLKKQKQLNTSSSSLNHALSRNNSSKIKVKSPLKKSKLGLLKRTGPSKIPISSISNSRVFNSINSSSSKLNKIFRNSSSNKVLLDVSANSSTLSKIDKKTTVSSLQRSSSVTSTNSLSSKSKDMKIVTPKIGYNIKVAVRVRGTQNTDKLIENSVHVMENSPNKIMVSDSAEKKESSIFQFDHVFGPQVTQSTVFDTVVKPVIDEVLQGYNCTIFAYGQTGTGKTYTMEGNLNTNEIALDHNAGIIPRTLHCLFERLGTDQSRYSVNLSMVELYNEELCDLLSDSPSSKLTLANDAYNKVQLQGLEEIMISTTDQGISLLKKGSARRHTSSTSYNAKSSRSHSIFTLTVHMKSGDPDNPGLVKEGKFYLVDLAGSEDYKASGSNDLQAKETCMINQSLLSLGRVITTLASREEAGQIYIPYRASKLTRILQDSLGGGSKTYIIATIASEKSQMEETIGTLKYASKAMKINNKPIVNKSINDAVKMKDLESEVRSLRNRLQEENSEDPVKINSLMLELQNAKDQIHNLTNTNASLKNEFEEKYKKLELFHEETKNKMSENENLFAFTLEEKNLELNESKELLANHNEKLKRIEETLKERDAEILRLKNDSQKDHNALEKSNQRTSELLTIAIARSNDVVKLQEEFKQESRARKCAQAAILQSKESQKDSFLSIISQLDAINNGIKSILSSIFTAADKALSGGSTDSEMDSLSALIDFLDADIEYFNAQISSNFRNSRILSREALKKVKEHQKAVEHIRNSWNSHYTLIKAESQAEFASELCKIDDKLNSLNSKLHEITSCGTELSNIAQLIDSHEKNELNELEILSNNFEKLSFNELIASINCLIKKRRKSMGTNETNVLKFCKKLSSIIDIFKSDVDSLYNLQHDTNHFMTKAIDRFDSSVEKLAKKSTVSEDSLITYFTEFCQSQLQIYDLYKNLEKKNNESLNDCFPNIKSKITQLRSYLSIPTNPSFSLIDNLEKNIATAASECSRYLKLYSKELSDLFHSLRPIHPLNISKVSLSDILQCEKWKSVELTVLSKLQESIELNSNQDHIAPNNTDAISPCKRTYSLTPSKERSPKSFKTSSI